MRFRLAIAVATVAADLLPGPSASTAASDPTCTITGTSGAKGPGRSRGPSVLSMRPSYIPFLCRKLSCWFTGMPAPRSFIAV